MPFFLLLPPKYQKVWAMAHDAVRFETVKDLIAVRP